MQPVTKTASSSDLEMAEAGIIEIPVQERIKKTEKTDDDPDADPEEELGEDGKPKVKPGDDPDADPEKKKNTKAKTGDDPEPEDDIEDEKLLKALNKKSGKNFKTLDEYYKAQEPAPSPKILTADEQKEADEQKKQDALKFGLEKNLFKKKDYDNYLIFNNRSKEDVVKDEFAAELRKEDADISDEDIEEQFKTTYHLFDDEKSIKYKKGMQQIEALYDKIKTEKFGAIVDVESVYEGVQKNIEHAKVFKTELDTTLSKMESKLSFDIDGEKINATLFTPEQAESIKANYLTSEMMQALLTEDGKINADALSEEIKKDFMYDNFNSIVAEAAKTLADRKVKAYQKSRKAANFSEDAIESDLPGGSSTKSASDLELEEAERDGIIR